MDKVNILWADDEIELLRPHVLFLEEKGYQVKTVNSGSDALEQIDKEQFDIVLLDENMPGLSGLETLTKIKSKSADLPVIMITKSEEEHIMDDAIGSRIADYLIKPVNPKQILLTLKKNLEKKRLIGEKAASGYQQEFRNIGMTLSDKLSFGEWEEVYRKLVYWELELHGTKDPGMAEILMMQKKEANTLFSRFIENNYLDWLHGKSEAPVMSHTLMKNKVLPLVNGTDPVFLLVIDNLRFDQWKVIQPVLNEYFRLDKEEMYCSILPTATQYARNAIFAGMLPSEIEKRHPKMWLNDDDEGGKNQFEQEFLEDQLKRLGKNYRLTYNKVTTLSYGKKLAETLSNLMTTPFNVIVYNFVDMLSHARTEMEVIRELADDEAAYRSLTLSWFEHSPLMDIIRQIAERGAKLIITTDHGTIRVSEPSKVVGDRNTNTNLRYKQGKSLDYVKKDVFEVRNPADAFLPKINVSTAYIFVKEDKFFAYPNNFNYYVNYYRNTFQHGGISLEEMLVPFVVMSPR